MPSSKRFETAIKKYGFKIRKVPFRPDILSVQFMNKHMMTIPRTIYAFKSMDHKDMLGHTHPDYFDLEKQAQERNIMVKRSNWLNESWYAERLEASRK